jgi:hypothetical protein
MLSGERFRRRECFRGRGAYYRREINATEFFGIMPLTHPKARIRVSGGKTEIEAVYYDR